MSALTFAAIGIKALELHEKRQLRRQAEFELRSGYDRFKEARGLNRVERDTAVWDAMLKATATEYALLQRAKAAERSKLRSLEVVCRKARVELNVFCPALGDDE